MGLRIEGGFLAESLEALILGLGGVVELLGALHIILGGGPLNLGLVKLG